MSFSCNYRFVLLGIVCVLFAGCAFEAQGPARQADFYVSADGDDSNCGTAAKPFATIERARDAVREKISRGMRRDVVVVLRGGVYYAAGSIRFDERDSGKNGHSVIYKGAEGQKVTIYPGKPVTGWEKLSVDGKPKNDWERCLANGDIYRAKVRKGKRFFRLFADDHSLVMARNPNKGSGYGGGLTKVSNTIVKVPDGWVDYDFSDAQVFGFLVRDWFAEMREVISFDRGKKELTIDAGSGKWNGINDRIYIQGVKELLDEPGEWCLDHKQGWLYYMPKGSIESQIIVAPATQRVLDIRGSSMNKVVSNIRFEGINFIGSDFSARWWTFTDEDGDNAIPDPLQEGLIYIENAKDITIRSCKIIGAGHSGVFINKYAKNCSVYGCWIEDAGFAGVYMNGWVLGKGPFKNAKESDVNKGHTISNNYIYDCGAFIGHGCGVQFFQSGDNTITHNLISKMPRYGISYKGWCYVCYSKLGEKTLYGTKIDYDNQFDILHTRNNMIAYNDISSVCRDSHDYGAIESWGAGRDNAWFCNAIHDLDPAVNWDGAAHALFADDASHYLTIRNNIVYQCHGGRDTAMVMVKSIEQTVENNIFADNSTGFAASVRAYIDPAYNMVIRRNIFSGDFVKLWTTRDRTFKLYFTDPKIPEDTPIVKINDYNLFYPPHKDIGEYKEYGWSINCIQEDPLFDRKNPKWDSHFTDYKLKADSPAFKLGFKAIDMSKIGLKDDFAFDRGMFFYKRADEKIQAENYERMKGIHTKGGTGINSIERGAWTKYENVDFGDGNLNRFTIKMTFAEGAKSAKGKSCSIRIDAPNGKLIGRLQKKRIKCRVKPVKGRHTVYLVFDNGMVESVDWFKFSRAK